MTDKLMPCPFCGETPGVEMNQIAGYRAITVACACGARGKPFVKPSGNDSNLAEAAAVRAWNTRPPAEPSEADVERVAEIIEGALFRHGVTDFAGTLNDAFDAIAAMQTPSREAIRAEMLEEVVAYARGIMRQASPEQVADAIQAKFGRP